MSDDKTVGNKPTPITTGEWWIAFAVAAAGCGYLAWRLYATWGVWPEGDASKWGRIVEIGLVGVFVVWAFVHAVRRRDGANSR